MTSFLDAIFETKAPRKRGKRKDETFPQSVARATTSTRYMAPGQAYDSSWSVDRAVTDAFERTIWVYRAITAIAGNTARLPIQVRKDAEDGDIVENEQLHRLLNRRANPHETAAAFRFRLSCQLLLSKQGAFVEVVRSRGDEPAALFLLPPALTRPIPDPKTYVSGYELRMPSGNTEILKPEQVLWIKQPHPIDPYSGSTPLEAAGLSVDLDFYARLFNRTFLLNDGRPGGLVSVRGRLTKDDAEELKRRFSGGVNSAGRTTVIEADDVSWVDTATTPRDAQYVQIREQVKEEILLAFGVPESVIGNASGRTYDNADAEFDIFWRVTMQPHLDLIAAAFDILTGDTEDDNFVVHDTSHISALQRDERAEQDRALAEFNAGTISLDQYLERVKRDPVDVPASRVHWFTAAGKVPIGTDEDVIVAQRIASGQSPEEPPDEEQLPAEPEGGNFAPQEDEFEDSLARGNGRAG